MADAITFKYDDDGLQKLAGRMNQITLNQSFRDSAQFVESSTKAGYQNKVDPEGKKWVDNSEWYKQAKGEAAILTGPTSSDIKQGPLRGRYKFNVNPKRMQQSLISRVGKDTLVVEYDSAAKERARLTQLGGKTQMTLKSTDPKKRKDLIFDIDIQQRIHLGLSTRYSRVGEKNDIEHIKFIFEDNLNKQLAGKI